MWHEINHMMFMIDLTWCDMYTRNCQVCDTKSTTWCSWSISHDVICDTRYDIRIYLEQNGVNFRCWINLGWYAWTKLVPRPSHASKHTLTRQARSILNDLQQNEHEKASLVCVRVQSPSGPALVPCALSMVDLSGQLRCWITHIHTE